LHKKHICLENYKFEHGTEYTPLSR